MKKKLLIVPGVLVVAAFGVYVSLFRFGPTGKPIEIRVAAGTPLRAIAAKLEKERVIPWSKALVLWMKLQGTEKHIQAGIVEFVEHEGVVSAAKKLLNARPVEYAVTIPEGLTIEQTAAAVRRVFSIDTAEFVSLCTNNELIKSLGLSAPSLEGYLFPNTYRFTENPTCGDIIRRMVADFKESFATLTGQPDIQSRFDMSQIVILASIVEKEAQVGTERPRIAAVFHNRLRKGMPLGADPTVRYVLKKYSGPLHVSELKIKSPYNTRLYAGLPPGPICSPGLASLQAALNPDQTKELYFVAKWDGSGAHDFSLTYEDHNRKKETIQRRNEMRISREKNGKGK